jgi:hypothetical protein
MCSHGAPYGIICHRRDCPSAELLDNSICPRWFERDLPPEGFTCPRCGRPARRLCRAQGHFPAYRRRACERYDTMLTGTLFAKTRQRPATLVRRLRGIAKGEPTARLAHELGRSRTPLQTLRQRLQTHRNDTAPTGVMRGTALEADELDQHAGETPPAPSRPPRAAPPACP